MTTKNDLEYHKQKLKEWKDRHKKAGLCVYCKQKAVKGKRQCKAHLEYHKYYKKFRGKKGDETKKGVQKTDNQNTKSQKKTTVSKP